MVLLSWSTNFCLYVVGFDASGLLDVQQQLAQTRLGVACRPLPFFQALPRRRLQTNGTNVGGFDTCSE